jgi:hypothetical protein
MTATFPFDNHSRTFQPRSPLRTQSDEISSQGTTVSLDDDSSSFNVSSTSLCDTIRSTNENTVTFDDSYNEEYANDSMVKSELRDLWYQPSDYQLFRTIALEASQQIVATERRNRAPHSYQRVLERTYAACSNYNDTSSSDNSDNSKNCCTMETDESIDTERISLSSKDENDSEADDITITDSTVTTDSDVEMEKPAGTTQLSSLTSSPTTIISAEDFVHLQRWLEVGSSRIGLEKWSIRTISNSRTQRREEMIETVLSLQQNRQQQFLSHPSTQQKQQMEDCSEFIRATCERLSRPSSLFCVVMAQGLAAAVVKGNTSTVI